MVTKVVVGILHSIYAFINLAFLSIYPEEKSLKDKVVLVSTYNSKLNNINNY